MTIEIEAGASHGQFSMKLLGVHAFFGGQPWRLSMSDADWSPQLPSRKSHFIFQRDTIPKPSA
jgi:hypothetical protein